MKFHFKRSSATHLRLSFQVAFLAATALCFGRTTSRPNRKTIPPPITSPRSKRAPSSSTQLLSRKGLRAIRLSRSTREQLVFANKGGVHLIAVDLGKSYTLNTVKLKFTKPAHAKIYVVKAKPQGTATPPSVSSDEMKLSGVQGPVSLKLADGNIRPGENGMTVPSGATVIDLGQRFRRRLHGWRQLGAHPSRQRGRYLPECKRIRPPYLHRFAPGRRFFQCRKSSW